MPKIRDLGISTIPFARHAELEPDAAGIWLCNPTDTTPEPCQPTPKCTPTNKPCNPTPKPCQGSTGKPGGGNKYTLPHDAVEQLRYQLQQQISRPLQS